MWNVLVHSRPLHCHCATDAYSLAAAHTIYNPDSWANPTERYPLTRYVRAQTWAYAKLL